MCPFGDDGFKPNRRFIFSWLDLDVFVRLCGFFHGLCSLDMAMRGEIRVYQQIGSCSAERQLEPTCRTSIRTIDDLLVLVAHGCWEEMWCGRSRCHSYRSTATMGFKGAPQAKQLDGSNLRIGIVHARWNESIISALLEGVDTQLAKMGVRKENIIVQSVPGSFELPFACSK